MCIRDSRLHSDAVQVLYHVLKISVMAECRKNSDFHLFFLPKVVGLSGFCGNIDALQYFRYYKRLFGQRYRLCAVFYRVVDVYKRQLKLIDYTPLTTMDGIFRLPEFTFVQAINGNAGIEITATMVINLLVLFAPVALVVFAEHIADHKNLSSVIGRDLIKDPGLDKTLLGDGVGSMAGAVFGGRPNTTYGEAIGCVAISGNASIYTIITTAILCLIAVSYTHLNKLYTNSGKDP